MNQANPTPAYYQPQQQVRAPPPQQALAPGQSGGVPPGAGAATAGGQAEADLFTDGLVDPTFKCCELAIHLKTSLQFLLQQLPTVLNPSNDRLSTENQFQLLGKYIENFNRVCDLLVVNLRTACEAQQITNDIKNFSRYYASINNPNDNRNEPMSVANSIAIQMHRIAEFKALLARYTHGGSSAVAVLKPPQQQPVPLLAEAGAANNN